MDLRLSFVDGKALEVKKQLDAKRRKKLINSQLNRTKNVGQSSAQDVEIEEEKIRRGIEAYKSSHKTTPEYRQELKDYMIDNGDFIYEDGWNKSVIHLRQWYPIIDEQAADPNLMDSTPTAANPDD
ncbi:hypothetical protein Scep_029425 [Stephania cephalantha]|uniref:Uncharacterized protein n=1 Tax=Stephania cephalantha TaxID=152367 RepID=A0AAP0DXM5_9MAGN